MKLGVSTYTFGWAVGVKGCEPSVPMDEVALLNFAEQNSISVVQIGDNLPLCRFDSDRLRSLAASARSKNIQLEVGARRLTSENVAQHLFIARTLDAKLLRFVIDDTDYHPEPDTIVSILREIAPQLGETILGIENHDRFPAQILRRIVEQADSPNIGVCLDTANSLGAGEGLEHVLDHLARHTVNLHIKDFWIERLPHMMGFTVSGRPAGDGMLEIEDLLDAVQRFKRCDTAILELWTPPEPQLARTIEKEARWAAQSLEYLKPLFRHRYE
jgi:3-oxoisoapionate decarboxylase